MLVLLNCGSMNDETPNKIILSKNIGKIIL